MPDIWRITRGRPGPVGPGRSPAVLLAGLRPVRALYAAALAVHLRLGGRR